MPPRQRPTGKAKPKDKAAGSKKEDDRKEDDSPAGSEEPSSEQQQQQQQQRTRKGGVSWAPVFKRIGFFMLIILIPALLNYAALNQETRMLVPNGSTLYDIGWNQKLLLRCTGQGLPTVILEAPVGQSSDVWVLVEPLVAKMTTVCVYDRAGLGFSDRAYQNTSQYSSDFGEAAAERDRTQPSTTERMVDDLHRLITYSSNQPKPVLLVSLDFSTFISRFYAQLYEHEVAGLLLVDPAFEMLLPSDKERDDETSEVDSENPSPLTWHEYWYKRIVPHTQGVWLSAVVGFNRLSLMVGLTKVVEEPKLVKILSQEVQTRKKHLLCQPKHLSSALNEYFYMNESMQQMRTVLKVKPFPEHLPITIATYEKAEESNLDPELAKVWIAGQNQLMSTIHPESNHITLPGSDYLTLYTHPKAVANAILTMVDRWRRDSRISE